MEVIETVTKKGDVLTKDLGGSASTTEFTNVVLAELK